MTSRQTLAAFLVISLLAAREAFAEEVKWSNTPATIETTSVFTVSDSGTFTFADGSTLSFAGGKWVFKGNAEPAALAFFAYLTTLLQKCDATPLEAAPLIRVRFHMRNAYGTFSNVAAWSSSTAPSPARGGRSG